MIDISNNLVYRSENIEIDTSRRSVKRCGEEQYLRQQTFQVLLCLLERRERLVTKDELIENVWQGTAVTDNALVQCIMDIRRALGDDSHHPKFIKTFPKIGYRFVGKVEETHPYAYGSIEIEEITAVQVEIEKKITTQENEGRAHANAVTQRLPFTIHLSQPLHLALTVGAMVILVVVLSAFLSQRFSGSDRNRADVALPQLPGRIPLAVMHFENRSQSKELDWLREGMADMLITNLSRSPKLTVLSRQQLHLLLERVEHNSSEAISLNESLWVARTSRAEVILLGSFARLIDKVRIEVQLYEAKTARLIAAEYLVVDRPEQILEQIDLLSWKVAARLGAAPDKDSQRDLTSVMTDNLEAYRYYSLALEKAQALHNSEAIALLEKAIAHDPRFAMAHARIGFAYAVSWGYAEKGKPHLERAFKLSDRLTEKDKLYITAWYAIAQLDYSGAISIFRQILAAYPAEIEAFFRLGRLLRGEERLDEALEVVRQGLVYDPEAKDLHNLMGGIFSELGRHDEAIAAHQRYVALAPGEPNAYDSLGLSHQWAGRYAEAIEEYGRALALDPEFEIAVIHLGNTYFQQGRYREAIAQYQRYIQIASSDGERARGYGCIAQVKTEKGDLALAEQAARMELKYEKTNAWNSMVLALERDNAKAAEAFKKQLLAERPYTERGSRPTLRHLHYFRGYFDLMMGRTAEAVEAFKEALRHRPLPWNIDSYEDSLAQAYIELGQFDEAIAEYERILRLNPNYPLAHYHLGQAFERKGLHDGARTSYERFLQIWKDADADLAQVIAARKYLALGS